MRLAIASTATRKRRLKQTASPSTRHGFNHSRAVTLLEVLLTILLVAVGTMVALQGMWSNLRLARQSHTTLVAIKGVQEYQLELLRSRPYTDSSLNPGTYAFTAPPLDSTSGVDQLPSGSAQYIVALEGGDPNLKRLTVTVGWTDPDGRIRSSSVSTLISK